MTLEEIKTAVSAGNRVHWVNSGYVVTRDGLGQYLITFTLTGSAIGLTSRDDTRLNEKQVKLSNWGIPRFLINSHDRALWTQVAVNVPAFVYASSCIRRISSSCIRRISKTTTNT